MTHPPDLCGNHSCLLSLEGSKAWQEQDAEPGLVLARERGYVLPKYVFSFSPPKEKLMQFRCTNLRNPEATLIPVTITQHISPGYTDPGTGNGAVFHRRACVDIQLPSRAGHTRLLPEPGEGRCQIHLGQITMQDPLRLS